jgi:hypothetical protein
MSPRATAYRQFQVASSKGAVVEYEHEDLEHDDDLLGEHGGLDDPEAEDDSEFDEWDGLEDLDDESGLGSSRDKDY